MNNYRRKLIDELKAQLEDIKASIEDLTSEEQDAFDNIPENLKASEIGEAMETAISELEEAASLIEDIIEHLENAEYGGF